MQPRQAFKPANHSPVPRQSVIHRNKALPVTVTREIREPAHAYSAHSAVVLLCCSALLCCSTALLLCSAAALSASSVAFTHASCTCTQHSYTPMHAHHARAHAPRLPARLPGSHVVSRVSRVSRVSPVASARARTHAHAPQPAPPIRQLRRRTSPRCPPSRTLGPPLILARLVCPTQTFPHPRLGQPASHPPSNTR